MSKIIIADSSCDIDVTKFDVDVKIVPMSVNLDDKVYVDDYTNNLEDFITSMEKAQSTSSACPSPNTWFEAAKDYDEIYMVTLSSRLSGSFNSAMTAKNMLEDEFEDKKIMVIDAKSAAGALILICEKLQELIKEGKTFDEIKREIIFYPDKIKTTFSLVKYDNFVRNGRMSKLAFTAATALNLCFVAQGNEGVIDIIAKCRGSKKAFKQLCEIIKENGYKGKMIITYCLDETNAKVVFDYFKAIDENLDIRLVQANILCGYYIDRGGVVVAYEV